MGIMLRGLTPRTDTAARDDTTSGPTGLDRARRLHSTHQRGPNRRCGLCLQSWPCSERTWADRTLRTVAKPAATPRWSARWSAPLSNFYRWSESSRSEPPALPEAPESSRTEPSSS